MTDPSPGETSMTGTDPLNILNRMHPGKQSDNIAINLITPSLIWGLRAVKTLSCATLLTAICSRFVGHPGHVKWKHGQSVYGWAGMYVDRRSVGGPIIWFMPNVIDRVWISFGAFECKELFHKNNKKSLKLKSSIPTGRWLHGTTSLSPALSEDPGVNVLPWPGGL